MMQDENKQDGQNSTLPWLPADWSAPPWIHAGTTFRQGGFSQPPYNQLNLAEHVGDVAKNVSKNREYIKQHLNLPSEPLWLNQQHGNNVLQFEKAIAPDFLNSPADGSYTNQQGIVCAVMTADCLPLLLCDNDGTEVAAIHIGWRGFCKDIISPALLSFETAPDKILAWIGPCICKKHYEIDKTVKDKCLYSFEGGEDAFSPGRSDHWYMDLPRLVALKLTNAGIKNIYYSQHCTYHEDNFFYSYRRKNTTGRMASLIWIDSTAST